jgi:hypothetical protein
MTATVTESPESPNNPRDGSSPEAAFLERVAGQKESRITQDIARNAVGSAAGGLPLRTPNRGGRGNMEGCLLRFGLLDHLNLRGRQ